MDMYKASATALAGVALCVGAALSFQQKPRMRPTMLKMPRTKPLAAQQLAHCGRPNLPDMGHMRHYYMVPHA